MLPGRALTGRYRSTSPSERRYLASASAGSFGTASKSPITSIVKNLLRSNGDPTLALSNGSIFTVCAYETRGSK